MRMVLNLAVKKWNEAGTKAKKGTKWANIGTKLAKASTNCLNWVNVDKKASLGRYTVGRDL